MDKTNEEKARDFLKYVAQNERQLKKNLIKNVTFNKALFDDVFSETIVKIYNTISKNGTEIEDFKHYFFTSSKFTYIYRDNNHKKHQKTHISDFFDDECNQPITEQWEERQNRRIDCLEALRKMKELLCVSFAETDVDMFFDYFWHKMDGRFSFNDIAKMYNTTPQKASLTIKAIKQHITSTPQINNLRNVLH